MANSGLSLVFDYTGLRDIAGRFTKASDELVALIDFKMQAASQRALEIAREFAPGEGDFKAGFAITTYGEHGFAITTNNPQLLEWIRRGTGIYAGNGPIVTQNAAALVFASSRWPRSPIPPNFGDSFAFRSVKGMRANPWETEALDEILSELTPILQEVVGEFAGELGVL